MRRADASSYARGRRPPVFCSSQTVPQPYSPSVSLPQTFRTPPAQPFRTPPQHLLSSPPAFQYPPVPPFPALQIFPPSIPSIQTLFASIPLLQTSAAPFGSFQYQPARLPAVPRHDYCADHTTHLHAGNGMRCDVPARFSSPSSYSFPNPAATNPLLPAGPRNCHTGGDRSGGHQSVMIHSAYHNSHNSLPTLAPVHVPLNRTNVVSTSHLPARQGPSPVHQGTPATHQGSRQNTRGSSKPGYLCNRSSVKLKQNKQKKKKKMLKLNLLKSTPEGLMQVAANLNESKQKKLEVRSKKKLKTASTPNGAKGKKSELAPENIIQDEIYKNGSKQEKLEASPEKTMQEELTPDVLEELETLPDILMLQVYKQKELKRKEPKQKKLKPKKVKIESYYCRTMVMDPWQHLKPVAGNILEPLAGPWSWLPESLTADKEKAPESNLQFNFKSTDSSLCDIFDTCVQEVLES